MRSLAIWLLRLGLLAVATTGAAIAGERVHAQLQQQIDASVDAMLPPVSDGTVVRDAGLPLRR